MTSEERGAAVLSVGSFEKRSRSTVVDEVGSAETMSSASASTVTVWLEAAMLSLKSTVLPAAERTDVSCADDWKPAPPTARLAIR